MVVDVFSGLLIYYGYIRSCVFSADDNHDGLNWYNNWLLFKIGQEPSADVYTVCFVIYR